MDSNDEGQGSGDCDEVYRAADEFFSLRQEYIYDEWPECQAQVYRFPVSERQPVVSLGSC